MQGMGCVSLVGWSRVCKSYPSSSEGLVSSSRLRNHTLVVQEVLVKENGHKAVAEVVMFLCSRSSLE